MTDRSAPNTARGFFARRWHGELPLARLFWRDMVAVGSVLNLTASLVALLAAAGGASTGVAVALHFAPLPYNLFLFGAVWRHSRQAPLYGLAAVIWLIVASLI